MNKSVQKLAKSYPFIAEGYVVDTDDPDQMGRVKVWCPSIDGEHFRISNLPWAEYASPFGGITTDFPAGRDGKVSQGHVAYGFWCVPKLNSIVAVFHINGNPNRRCYFASMMDLHRNRSLPGGRNVKPDPKKPKIGPWTDTYEPLEPAYSNLREQFNNEIDTTVAVTRGSMERQVAQDRDNKDGNEGYAKYPLGPEGYKDPQSYCWVTPGHHFITMSDNPDNCRVRVKTCEGHQIIMDDTNERIYISTAKGKTWIELDEDGHIHIYGNKSISICAEDDINLTAGKNVNIKAGSDINIKSDASVKMSSGNVDIKAGEKLAASGCTVDVNGKTTRITGDSMDIKSKGLYAMEGSKVTVKTGTSPTDYDRDEWIVRGGPAAEATCAEEAGEPSIVPRHEPWGRPDNSSRNKLFKG